MRLRMSVVLVVALMAVASSVGSATASPPEPSQHKSDPISGEWDAAFESESDSNSFALTFKFKIDGDKVTGTYESSQTGGKISKGSWAANKLSLALETGHGSMVVTGVLKGGKLAGEFDGGHMKGKWEAIKK